VGGHRRGLKDGSGWRIIGGGVCDDQLRSCRQLRKENCRSVWFSAKGYQLRVFCCPPTRFPVHLPTPSPFTHPVYKDSLHCFFGKHVPCFFSTLMVHPTGHVPARTPTPQATRKLAKRGRLQWSKLRGNVGICGSDVDTMSPDAGSCASLRRMGAAESGAQQSSKQFWTAPIIYLYMFWQSIGATPKQPTPRTVRGQIRGFWQDKGCGVMRFGTWFTHMWSGSLCTAD